MMVNTLQTVGFFVLGDFSKYHSPTKNSALHV